MPGRGIAFSIFGPQDGSESKRCQPTQSSRERACEGLDDLCSLLATDSKGIEVDKGHVVFKSLNLRMLQQAEMVATDAWAKDQGLDQIKGVLETES